MGERPEERGASSQLRPLTKITAEKARRRVRRGEPKGLRRSLLVLRGRVLNEAGRDLTRLLGRIERARPTERVRCPICGWRGLAFRPFVGPGYLTPNVLCPECGSFGRQRLFYLVWSERSMARPGRVLYFAPERCLTQAIDQSFEHVLTTDLFEGDVDFTADIEQTPLPDESVAMCLCSDVLQCVEHDVFALREIRRVLEPGGVALVHVPVVIDRTVEFGWALEGAFGHRRSYGVDVVDRMREAGLAVAIVAASAIAPVLRKHHGINPRDALFVLARSREPIEAWQRQAAGKPSSVPLSLV